MSLTASKRFIGWKNCRITPVGGSATNIDGLTDCAYQRGIKPLLMDGDLDMYDTTGVVTKGAPTFKVTTNKPGILDTIPPGMCTFYVERWDAQNLGAAGGGAISYTMNALYVPDDQTGGQRAEGKGSFTVFGVSVDGTTNPVAVAAL